LLIGGEFMSSFIGMVLETCGVADRFRARKSYGVLSCVVEEVGEVAQEVAVANGDSYKCGGVYGLC